MSDPYFTTKTFAFLKDLAQNNSREWFKANQETFEEHVREPALEFIEDFTPALEAISPHFVASARKSGGSLFRIHKDTRFSKDKTPYKTNTGMQFRHEKAKDVHAPGFYLHIEPSACFMGIGLWRPETKVAYQIREAIDTNPKAWLKATTDAAFIELFTQEGDSLSRPPKGYDKDHPLLVDLKRKDFIASTKMTQKQITSPDLLETFAANCEIASDYMAFLCKAVGVKF